MDSSGIITGYKEHLRFPLNNNTIYKLLTILHANNSFIHSAVILAYINIHEHKFVQYMLPANLSTPPCDLLYDD